MQTDRIPILAVAGGIASHLLFNRFEPRSSFFILSLLLGPPGVIAVFLLCTSSIPSPTAILKTYALHFISLTLSVVAYRLSPYHPLAAFPGPVTCKISRLWALYMVQTGNQHRYYRALHARYGTHVRTGPNHLHICDAKALPTVMGINPFRRGERYGVTTLRGSTGSLISVVDPHEHAQRRKIWDRSMNTSALVGYEDKLAARIGQLVTAFERRVGLEVDISEWLSSLAFDFMGDLAFGGAFHHLEKGSDREGYMGLSTLTMRFQETVGMIPWIKPLAWLYPGAHKLVRFRRFATASVLARKSHGSSTKDIFYYLLDEEGVGHGPPSLPTLILESGLSIIAGISVPLVTLGFHYGADVPPGSDTTAVALSNLFFYLLSHPEILARLRQEVDSVFPPGADAFSPAAAADMKLLNAVINETLRLQPAVPNGVQRLLPLGSGGVEVAGRWVPEGTTVQISAYSAHRDPRYFYPEPESFRPDRWLETKPGSILDHSAYFPFSYGPTNCVGKGLAILELRTVVCNLIHKFEFELRPGFRREDWEGSLGDWYILAKGQLPVRINARKAYSHAG
ncbi:cytochrome P450 [Gautieria morchelliformis]|nr:cytochrome P450 [Gautieria morchelliformis]